MHQYFQVITDELVEAGPTCQRKSAGLLDEALVDRGRGVMNTQYVRTYIVSKPSRA